MEEKKELKQFGIANLSTDGKSVKTPFSERNKGSTLNAINTDKTYNVSIGKGVIIHLNDEIMYSIPNVPNIKKCPYRDFVLLDKVYGDLIERFTPPLYKEFIVKGKLINHVNINDRVIINPKYKEKDTGVRILIDIYFKSLNNMTVLIGVLDDMSLVLYNRLILCK
jgi:hypothetical protein